MSFNEFKKWLEKQGVKVKKHGAKHDLLELNGKKSLLGRHGAKEIPTGTRHKTIKDLGL